MSLSHLFQNGSRKHHDGDGLKAVQSVHRQSDKGMGVAEFVKLVQGLGKEGILQEYEQVRAASKMISDDQFSVCR